MQKIALYSNGMAVFTRLVNLKNNELTEVELPVKSEYLDEVLSSLEIYGEVEIKNLPSYTPAISAEQYDLTNMQRDLMKKFSGQDIKLSLNSGGTHVGKLVGLQDRNANINGVAVQVYDVLVHENGKIRICAAEDVENIEFSSERIKSEINKLLNNASQLACPNSKTIKMSLMGKGEAILQFTVPVAAWKMRYGLRLTEKGCEFNGQAIVDNNTDEDWKDACLTVVTGEPISFATDLAQVKVPKRSKFDLVKEQTTGAIVASDNMDGGMELCSFAAPECAPQMAMAGGAAPLRAMSMSKRNAAPRAERPQANIHESGSYFQYTYQKETTIPANQSSIIPLFSESLNEAKKILYYNASENQKVFRAVSLTNELAQDLGSGVCTVFEDETYLGKCIIKDTPKGQDCFLIYAVESNVDAKLEMHAPTQDIIAVKKTRESFVTMVANVSTATYTFNNKKDEEFTVEIEHPHGPCQFDVLKMQGCKIIETKNGHKVRFILPKRTRLSFSVQETVKNDVVYNYDATALLNWWSYCGSKISGKFQSKSIQELIKLKDKLADINNSAAEFKENLKAATKEQERLIAVLAAKTGHAEMAKWHQKLDKTETEIETARTGIANSQAEAKKVEATLNDLYAKIEIDWKEEN